MNEEIETEGGTEKVCRLSNLFKWAKHRRSHTILETALNTTLCVPTFHKKNVTDYVEPKILFKNLLYER